jgi:hypothetical protein
MQTLKLKTTVQKDGHLRIDIPSPFVGDVEVVLMIQSDTNGKRKNDFSDLAGKLSKGYSLSNSVLFYEREFDPAVPSDDWSAVK